MTTIIYEAKGRAREYSELAANLYRGCDHGCTYCYAPLATRKKRENFVKPEVREAVINKFLKDAEELETAGEKRPILLSFTTDPYQNIDTRYEITRKAIQILHSHNLKVSVLTKGGKRAERDFDLLAKKPELSEFGVTLVFLDEDMRKEIEPNAAPTQERIDSLKKAHDLGIYTYVSLEPVWFPEDALKIIDLTHEFVDFYKVGKLNYSPQQNNVDWSKFKQEAVKKLNGYSKKYYVKKDLMKYC